VDDHIKQVLLSRFREYLDRARDAPEPPDDRMETTDLYSVFVELADRKSGV